MIAKTQTQCMQRFQELQKKIQKKLASLQIGESSNWNDTTQWRIDGEKFKISYNLKIYKQYGRKGATGTFEAHFKSNDLKKTISIEDIKSFRTVVWSWVKAWFI